MKRLLPFCFALVLTIASVHANEAQPSQTERRPEKRVALVLGNAAYESGPLKNAVNDAQDMAEALRQVGFEVIYRENLDHNGTKRAMREFGAKLRATGGIGMFYYAGHGVQMNGRNYLVPIHAKVETEEEVEYECVEAGFILAQMESAGNSMNIVILDACRNNPFARSFRSPSRGLAMMDAPSGSLIAYATAPGSVASDGMGRNGIYTQELLKNIRTPGINIEELFKRVRLAVRNLTQNRQTPWESSSLAGSFYFTSPPLAQPVIESKPSSAKTDFKSEKTKLTLWVDTTKWRVLPQIPNNAEFAFIHKNGDGYALVITERIPFPLANMKAIVLGNARQGAPDAKVVSEEFKVVNGLTVLALKIEATLQGVPVQYYGYFYSGPSGTIQVFTYTAKALFSEYESEFAEFLSGIEIRQ